jgi:hypothetical protein
MILKAKKRQGPKSIQLQKTSAATRSTTKIRERRRADNSPKTERVSKTERLFKVNPQYSGN